MQIRTMQITHEDLKLRKFVKDRLCSAGISKVVIERAANRIKITIHTCKARNGNRPRWCRGRCP